MNDELRVEDIQLGDGTAAVTEAVFMSDGALADIGDDFHVAVRVRLEARLRRDAVVVPDAQAAPAHALDIVIIGKGKMVARVQPAVLRMTKLGIWTSFDHLALRRWDTGQPGE